jgi:hypothetical protein
MFKSIFFKSVLFFSLVSLLSSCSKDGEIAPANLKAKTYSNLYAPQTGNVGTPGGGPFVKFSFSQNKPVTDDSWDIAFRGTTIIINGGSAIGITDEPIRKGNAAASIVSNTLNGVTTVPPASTFVQDGKNVYAIPTGSGNGWYTYNSSTNIISPIAGKIFVIKTHDGKYAKMEITSYYKDAPIKPDATALSRYFTFQYVYQAKGTNF